MTRAQELNITEFPYTEHAIIHNKKRVTYYEAASGYWEKLQYNEQGLMIRYDDSSGTWFTTEYDNRGRETAYLDSDGGWWKRVYEGDQMVHEENQYGIHLV
jgi:hypothetical protein